MTDQKFHLFLTKFDKLEVINYNTKETKQLVKVTLESSDSNLQSFYSPKKENYICYNNKGFYFINTQSLDVVY